MAIDNIRQFIKEKAEQFGAKPDNEFNKPYVERNKTTPDALKDNGAYFGFIHPEEEKSGLFHDFSLTIFPNEPELGIRSVHNILILLKYLCFETILRT